MALTELMLGGLLSTPKVKACADLLSGRLLSTPGDGPF